MIGCGLIAQVMHLPHLRELADRYEVAALCDLSEAALSFAGELFPGARRTTRWEDVVGEPLDAVLVLTPGSHAPPAVAAAEAGMHVFVEKPMCLSAAEGEPMIEAAERAGVCLFVGYMKRYDPAYEALTGELPPGIRAARITTLESPLEPYVAHYPLRRAADVDPDLIAELTADDEQRVTAAIGTDDPVVRRAYRAILLDSVVHELNATRGVLGEPTVLRSAAIAGAPSTVTASLAFGDVEAVFLWVDLPGIARYEMELAFYAPQGRAAVVFPSPFLRNAPTRLVLEGGADGTTSSWRTERTASYEAAFKRELVEFHACVREGREPRTSGLDGLRDVALCQAIVRCHLEGRPIADPTAADATARP